VLVIWRTSRTRLRHAEYTVYEETSCRTRWSPRAREEKDRRERAPAVQQARFRQCVHHADHVRRELNARRFLQLYDYEIGPPWDPKAWETYQKISYPFLHADRIETPTLFLGGERDFNVPVQGGQQMYQALRSLNIDTQLVIYPNEFHGITRPSYVRDRYERYLAWYESHVNGKKPVASTAAQK
jgi:alpha-beta hydrolase superfamily lysophospholipase